MSAHHPTRTAKPTEKTRIAPTLTARSRNLRWDFPGITVCRCHVRVKTGMVGRADFEFRGGRRSGLPPRVPQTESVDTPRFQEHNQRLANLEMTLSPELLTND